MKTKQEILNDALNIDNTITGILSAMEIYAQQFKPAWVKVTDGFPENEQVVIAFNNGNITRRMFFSMEESEPGFTHWMPLPLAPQEG